MEGAKYKRIVWGKWDENLKLQGLNKKQNKENKETKRVTWWGSWPLGYSLQDGGVVQFSIPIIETWTPNNLNGCFFKVTL